MKTRKLLSVLMLLALLAGLLPAGGATVWARAPEAPAADTRAVDVGPVTKLDYGYYLIGRSGWTVNDIGPADKFRQNYAASGEEYMLQTTLEEGQEFKVVLVSNGTQLGPWFPDPGGNYVVDAAHAGEKTIYFRPAYNSDWAEFGGYFYIADPPAYHVWLIQPAHGTLVADKTEAREGETVTVTPVPDDGYYPNFLRSNDYPPDFINPNAFTASFTMPANDVTVYMWTNAMSAAPGYYFSGGRNIQELGPPDRFQAQLTAYGDYVYETVLVEGDLLSLAQISTGTENGFVSNGYSLTNPEITADMAGHVRIFLSRTEREGYTKAFELLPYEQGTEDMWMTYRYFHLITVEPADHGAVSAPADAFEGDTVSLNVTHEEGYTLDTLTVLDETGTQIAVDGTSFVMPDSPVTVHAVFRQDAVYTVTLVGAGEGVNITSTKETAQEGDTVDVNVTTDADHRFVSITVTDEAGNEIETVKRPDGANKYRFTMPASNVTVTVASKTIYPLWLVNTQVDSLNCADILGDGAAGYDPAARTLTFSSAQPDFGTAYGTALINWTGEDCLTVEAPAGVRLAGNATYCLYAASGDVVINGDVTLDIPEESNGIWVMKTLTVNGSVTGAVKAIALYGLTGITVRGDVAVANQDAIRTVYSMGTVDVDGDFTASGYGVDAAGGIRIGGSAEIVSTDTANYGLRSGGAVSVGGSFAFSGKAAFAVSANGGFTCEAGVTVTNTSGKGIFASGGPITVGSGVWDVAAVSEPLKASGGILIPAGQGIVLPEGGVLGTATESGTSYTVVYESDETTPATHVIISAPVPAGYHIIVTDYTKGAAATGIEAETLYSGDVTFTVTCDPACAVAIDNGDGTYTRLTCTTVDDEHSFSVTVTDADVNLVVVLKGDADLNGSVVQKDCTLTKKQVSGESVFTKNEALQILAADVDGNGRLAMKDATAISKAVADITPLAW